MWCNSHDKNAYLIHNSNIEDVKIPDLCVDLWECRYMFHINEDRQTDRQTDRQAGTQAHRHAGRQTDRQTDNFNVVLSMPRRYGDGEVCAMWETETLVV